MDRLQRAAQAVTGWGWGVIGLVVVGGGLGALLGWRELVTVAAGALALLLLALPWIAGRRSLVASLEPSAERVAVGAPAAAVLSIERARSALPAGSIDVLVDGEAYKVDIPRLMAGQRVTRQIDIDTSRRGRVAVGPASIERSDPFGLLRRQRSLTGASMLVVHPRTVRIPAMAAGMVRDLDGQSAAELTVDDVAFHSLREYMPGDEQRIVHWRSSAKTGTLLVRQFEPSRRSDVLVCLSTDSTEHRDDDDFELAVSIAATVAEDAALDNRGLRVVTSPSRGGAQPVELDARSRARALDSLADVQSGAVAGIVDLATAVAAKPGASIAWLVVGSRVSARTMRVAASRLPPDVAAIVVRADAGATSKAARLGQTPVITVGLLEDLGRGFGLGALA